MDRLPADPRSTAVGTAIYHAGDRQLLRDGGVHKLEPRLADLLDYLVARRGETVSREELLDAIWRHEGSDEALTQAISRLRRLLGSRELIRTVPREGYRLLMQQDVAPATFIPQHPVASAFPLRKAMVVGASSGLLVIAVALLLLWPRELKVDTEYTIADPGENGGRVTIRCEGSVEECERARSELPQPGREGS